MPLATYADLQAAVAGWLARDDLAAAIPDFIAVFEAAANRRVRVRQMEHAVELTPTNGTAPLPADYLVWRRVTGARGRELDYAHPSWLQAAYPPAGQGPARAFSIEGANLVLKPADTGAVTLTYYRRIPPLADGANWLFAAHPDLYLFGALTEAQAFIADAEKATLWKARRDELFAEVETLAQKGKAPGPIRVVGAVV
jgi:hypothetical protein